MEIEETVGGMKQATAADILAAKRRSVETPDGIFQIRKVTKRELLVWGAPHIPGGIEAKADGTIGPKVKPTKRSKKESLEFYQAYLRGIMELGCVNPLVRWDESSDAEANIIGLVDLDDETLETLVNEIEQLSGLRQAAAQEVPAGKPFSSGEREATVETGDAPEQDSGEPN